PDVFIFRTSRRAGKCSGRTFERLADSGFMMRPRIVAIRTTGTSAFFSAARHPPMFSKASPNTAFANVRDFRNESTPLQVSVLRPTAAHIIRPTGKMCTYCSGGLWPNVQCRGEQHEVEP